MKRLSGILNWFFDGHGMLLVGGVFIFIALALFIRTMGDNRTLSGAVTKLWTENEGIHGQADYAAFTSDDGSRHSVTLFPTQYGLLSIGVKCTFEIDHWNVAQSMACDFNDKR